MASSTMVVRTRSLQTLHRCRPGNKSATLQARIKRNPAGADNLELFRRKPNYKYFPWRERPNKPLSSATWFSISRSIIEFVHTASSKYSEGDSYLETDMIEGAEQAFKVSTAAIFGGKVQQKQMQANDDDDDDSDLSPPVSPDSEDSGTSASSASAPVDELSYEVEAENADIAASYSVEMTDVFGKDLAFFYTEALKECKSRDQSVYYKLIDTWYPKVVSTNWLVGRRGDSEHTKYLLDKGVQLEPIFQMMPQSEEDEKKWHEDFKFLQDFFEKTTYQVLVDVPCEEIFYVQDNNTGMIVQGSETPVKATHRLTLEMGLRFKQPLTAARENFWLFFGGMSTDKTQYEYECSEWQVVDVDDWVRGSPAEELVHPSGTLNHIYKMRGKGEN